MKYFIDITFVNKYGITSKHDKLSPLLKVPFKVFNRRKNTNEQLLIVLKDQMPKLKLCVH